MYQPSSYPVTLSYDFILLEQPQLQTRGVAWVPAGTLLYPLANQFGFYEVVYAHTTEFIPVLACMPASTSSVQSLCLERPYRCYTSHHLDSLSTASVAAIHTTVYQLGSYQQWLFIQYRDGHLGFITKDDGWVQHGGGCFVVLVGYLLGAGWLAANLIASHSFWHVLAHYIPGFAFVAVGVFLLTGIALLVRSRSEFTFAFSLGALTSAIIGSMFMLAI